MFDHLWGVGVCFSEFRGPDHCHGGGGRSLAVGDQCLLLLLLLSLSAIITVMPCYAHIHTNTVFYSSALCFQFRKETRPMCQMCGFMYSHQLRECIEVLIIFKAKNSDVY